MSEFKGKCCIWGKVCKADQSIYNSAPQLQICYRYTKQRMFEKTAILVSEQNQARVTKSVLENNFLLEYQKIPTGALKLIC